MLRFGNFHVSRVIFALLLADIGILYVSISVGYYASYANSLSVFQVFGEYALQRCLFIASVLAGMVTFRLYDRANIRDRKTLPTRLVSAYIFATAAAALAFFAFRIDVIFRSAFAFATVLSFLGIFALRWMAPRLFNFKFWERRILVLGCGPKAARIEELEAAHPGAFKVVGYFMTKTDEDVCVPPNRVVHSDRALWEVVDDRRAEEVVIAVEDKRGAIPMEQLLDCRMRGVTVLDYPTFIEQQTGKVELSGLTMSWLVHSQGFASSGWLRRKIKRCVDLAASAILLIVTLPITLITALAIYCTDRGPIFYRQTRVGADGKPFTIVKFRSMTVDAEADGVAKWASRTDARVTPIGKFIRKTRIDEIPQILNVLRGEMSFIGPRPERPELVQEIAREIPFYKYRHYVKPGITGWAQVNYPYGASIEDAENKLKFDLYYLKNYSLFLDIFILFQTIRVVLGQAGAR